MMAQNTIAKDWQEENQMLKEEIKALKYEIDHLEKKLAVYETPPHIIMQKIGEIRKTSRFKLHLLTDRLPQEIDPRDSLAAHLVSKEFASKLFYYIFKHRLVNFFAIILPLLSLMFTLISVIFEPYFGWFTPIGLLSLLPVFLTMNRNILRALIGNFEWWAMLCLIAVFAGTFCDAVKFDPPRVTALIVGNMMRIYVICNDARQFSKKKDLLVIGFWVFSAIWDWVVLILWWCGKFTDVRQTIIPVGNVITIDVQSIGASVSLKRDRTRHDEILMLHNSNYRLSPVYAS
jgi:hypothetical protein